MGEDLKLTENELEKFVAQFRTLSNRAEFKKAHQLALQLMKEYPAEPYFAYREAVMGAEGARARHSQAAKKLQKLTRRLKSSSPRLRHAIRNEYYWFSHQPYKQFRLGQESVRKGEPRAYILKAWALSSWPNNIFSPVAENLPSAGRSGQKSLG